jgi:hypothetical protein
VGGGAFGGAPASLLGVDVAGGRGASAGSLGVSGEPPEHAASIMNEHKIQGDARIQPLLEDVVARGTRRGSRSILELSIERRATTPP